MTPRKLVFASESARLILRKLAPRKSAQRNALCASCAARHLSRVVCASYIFLSLSRASCRLQAAARKLLDTCLRTDLCALLCASFSPQDAQRLRLCAKCATCAARAPAPRAGLKYCNVSARDAETLRVLRSHLRVATS